MAHALNKTNTNTMMTKICD